MYTSYVSFVLDGMQLKVAWAKVIRRCRVLLTNIFRLRALWQLVHPGMDLNFISLDQSPSWFSNSASTGVLSKKGGAAPCVRENFAKAHERYTIFTTEQTNCDYAPGSDADPPHVFVLFKGKPGGRVLQSLLEMTDIPEWLHIQVQECGSYREEDVIEALRKVLPVATSSEMSMIVLLDWFSAHRTEKVIAFIESLGHVVLFHGGGCTPFTQINDTHLHALLKKFLIQLENKLTHEKRKDMHLNYSKGIPTLSRSDVLQVVETAWRMLDHGSISRKGYLQTGPGIPMSGPIKRDHVYKDLRRVWDEIDPPIGLQEMGQKLRDDAIAFVSEGFSCITIPLVR